jgi:hypothetical protein
MVGETLTYTQRPRTVVQKLLLVLTYEGKRQGCWTTTMLYAPVNLVFLNPCSFPSYVPTWSKAANRRRWCLKIYIE